MAGSLLGIALIAVSVIAVQRYQRDNKRKALSRGRVTTMNTAFEVNGFSIPMDQGLLFSLESFAVSIASPVSKKAQS